ncbi:hypothetical protein ACHAW5_007088 [Stephanodiscus triporus]|uniref:CCHC-type domain-containing protein n=1 Tax=Stephanodiscus triporus TaxID=2934178 RepID=A0ABD3N5M6_9STRA
MDGSTPSNQHHPPVGKRARGRRPKPKMTKEERRAKYTAKAHARRDAALARGRERDLTCYRCRKTGHSAENCKHAPPVAAAAATTTTAVEEVVGGRGGGGENGSTAPPPPPGKKRKRGGNICYKCGSTEHRIQLCPRIRPFLQKGKARIDFGKLGVLPYAECYVCNGSGHLASHCPESDRGLYPRGGSCRECGAVDHLAADCPGREDGVGKGEGRPSDDDDIDDDDSKSNASSNSATIDRYLEETTDAAEEEKTMTTTIKKKRRIVKF